MRLIKIIFISLTLIILPSLYLDADDIEKLKINIDLDNDENTEVIQALPRTKNIKIYKINTEKNPILTGEFKLEIVKLSIFNQYNLINRRDETLLEQDTSSVFGTRYKVEQMRYNSTQNMFFKAKFLVIDINKDGKQDFIQIEEPNVDNFGLYRHLIYLQDKGCTFAQKPNRVIKEKRSSWITGIYQDINKDGLPDKVEIKHKSYGVLLSKTKCIINIYLMEDTIDQYKEESNMHIVSKGLFYENINFRDIDDNGYPDIVILDIPRKSTSLSDAISKILDRHISIALKVYLYDETTGGYPSKPSFMKKINLDILKDFQISLDNDFNNDGYKDLLISQQNYSEIYTFDKENLKF